MASPPVTSRRRGYDLPPGSSAGLSQAGDTPRRTSHPSPFQSVSTPRGDVPPFQQPQRHPSLTSVEISRKVKACAACRKQKMLMDERSQWHQDIVGDLELIYSGVQELRERSALPPLAGLRSSSDRPGPDTMDPGGQDQQEDSGGVSPGDNNSPSMMNMLDEGLTDVTTQQAGFFPPSISQLNPRTSHPPLRSHDSGEDAQSLHSGVGSIRDFIAVGQISLADAQRLFDLYMEQLDYFVYKIGGRWRTLDALRARSPILTASILTVAALHDAASNHIYPICNRELRRLISASIFDRRVNRDHLRALCVASYWLSDVSWTLSGMAIRRATEINLSGNYQRVLAEGSEDAADCLRLWYNLFICDKNLSTLYSRQSLVCEDASIQGWEEFLKTPLSTDDDKRLMSQVSLHLILTSVHELFGPDNGVSIPPAFSTQIAHYSRQLDHWVGVWSTALKSCSSTIGDFPAKNALIYYQFSKLYLFSHVFRGLANKDPIPVPLREAASGAIAAATNIIELVLQEPDIAASLRGMPTYVHAMVCFACVFLLKLAAKRQDGLVEAGFVSDLASRLVSQFRSIQAGKWHLAHLMADGLEKSATSLLGSSAGEGLESSTGSALGKGGSGGIMGDPGLEDASSMSFGLYSDPNASPFQGSLPSGYGGVGGSGPGNGMQSMHNPIQSPDLTFGPQSFFEFSAAPPGPGNDPFGFP
ncbi:hypothetical protein J7T55_015173 [Diaporthe amygdali]|uniref:uncharacterized protein n=1 Tax=Phomopsis amygdali TaxID=1214568 RepID=UPI0022FE6173|nr:uncharacterized protein J7T55_015173 [Diaporthe amygdali]KAJ0120446.1 hypothetical protein J7T55_015173 [Diaporthe amygdali]